jgi:Flp pilus assembly protein TadG
VRKAGRRCRRGDRGAAAVELALVSLLLVTMLFAIVEFGRAVWMYQALTSASREAARYGITNAATSTSVPRYRDCPGIRDAARSRSPDLALTDAEITVAYVHPDDSTGGCTEPVANFRNGSRIEVTVARKLDINLPLVPLFDFTISATDSRSIYNGVDAVGATTP